VNAAITRLGELPSRHHASNAMRRRRTGKALLVVSIRKCRFEWARGRQGRA
jgi:hypothetical protein